MAVLDATNRIRVFRQFMRDCRFALGAVTKTDLKAAVDATDQWIDDNAAAYNTALPQPFRGQANAQAKTMLFCYVAMRRASLLKAEEDG